MEFRWGRLSASSTKTKVGRVEVGRPGDAMAPRGSTQERPASRKPSNEVLCPTEDPCKMFCFSPRALLGLPG